LRTPLCDAFGIDVPIFAFSHCRDVVAAVSQAGGFGVLGALAFSPEQLEIELAWIDEHVGGRPYGVDVVMPASYARGEAGDFSKADLEKMLPERHKQWIAQVLARYEVPELPGSAAPRRIDSLLGWSDSGGRSHVEIALKHPIRLLVNALGPPPKDVIDRAHAHGVRVAALVGSVAQARKQVELGVDLIVAQGWEAGGHTGDVSSMVLIPEVVDAVAPVPVLAAGGIGCGRQAVAGIALGAQGVWTGSIWLTVAEAESSPVLTEKLLHATSRDTVRSRSMTGKPARLLRTGWTEAWDGPDSPGPLPMPLQFMLNADAQARIAHFARDPQSRARELVGIPVGQIVGRMNEVRPTREVVYDLVSEFVDTVRRLEGLLEAAEKQG
jgi:NAD(P)H-dependent flavin oxidoreductase YrpB (nitropropane dioxygenase family)